jgi:hypothetical protein
MCGLCQYHRKQLAQGVTVMKFSTLRHILNPHITKILLLHTAGGIYAGMTGRSYVQRLIRRKVVAAYKTWAAPKQPSQAESDTLIEQVIRSI